MAIYDAATSACKYLLYYIYICIDDCYYYFMLLYSDVERIPPMDLSTLFQPPTTDTSDHDIDPVWSGPFRTRRRRGGRKRSRRHHTPYTLSERSPANPTWEDSVAHNVTPPYRPGVTGHLDLAFTTSTSELWRSTVSLKPTPSSHPRSIPALMDLHVTPTPSLVCRCGRVASPAKPSVRDVATSPIAWDSDWSTDDSSVAPSPESSVDVNQSPPTIFTTPFV